MIDEFSSSNIHEPFVCTIICISSSTASDENSLNLVESMNIAAEKKSENFDLHSSGERKIFRREGEFHVNFFPIFWTE